MVVETRDSKRRKEITMVRNFDFGAHWHQVIPYLTHPRIILAISQGVNGFVNNLGSGKWYREDTVPASYSNWDHYHCEVCERNDEIEIERLRESGELPSWFTIVESELNDAIEEGEIYEVEIDYFDEDEQRGIERILLNNQIDITKYGPAVDDCAYDCQTLCMLKEDILKPFHEWSALQFKLESYYFMGACHWWNPTFCLTLAELMFPSEKWRVRKSFHHTTIINAMGTKIFDLVYWGLEGRLDNYLWGKNVRSVDPSLGGDYAFAQSDPLNNGSSQ